MGICHHRDIQAEGWVTCEKAEVAFVESNRNPVAQQGTYILTQDGEKTLYLVNPQDKTYAQWDLQKMLGVVGAVMNGMGPPRAGCGRWDRPLCRGDFRDTLLLQVELY